MKLDKEARGGSVAEWPLAMYIFRLMEIVTKGWIHLFFHHGAILAVCMLTICRKLFLIGASERDGIAVVAVTWVVRTVNASFDQGIFA